MMSGFEVRGFNVLRDKIKECMGLYIAEMDGVDLTKPTAIVSVAKVHERYLTFEEALAMLDDVQEQLSKE